MTEIVLLSLIPLAGGALAIGAGFYLASKYSPLRKVDTPRETAEEDAGVPTGSFLIGRVEGELARGIEVYGHYTISSGKQGRNVMTTSRLAGAE